MSVNPPTVPPTRAPGYIGWLRVARLICLLLLAAITGIAVYISFFTPDQLPASTEANALAEHGTPIDPPQQLQDFTLPSQDGTSLKLSDLRGTYVLLFFGYTHCPDVCPTTLSDFVQVKRQLGAAASQVRFVFVSVDGERDTPPVLKRFMQNFDASFIGLQGDDTTLGRIGKDYGLYYKREKVAGTSQPYLVTHSSSVYLLDRAGNMRMIYSFGMPTKVISEDIGVLLASD